LKRIARNLMSKKAIVTGITGQDGAYLAQFLLSLGYIVYGTYRRTSSTNFWRIDELGLMGNTNLHLQEFDLTDLGGCAALLKRVKPDEVYNLAAQSFVGVSFEQPTTTTQITGLGALNLLEAIRLCDLDIRFYQASTSEMFGLVQEIPQTELTPFYPRSPYGVSKLYAHWMAVNYREAHNIFAASGILFNHESPLRGKEFVTRKITDGIARLKHGKIDCLELGNLDAQRDWGFAKDYVTGMWKMLQHPKADTFVLATDRTVPVRNFVQLAGQAAGIELEFEGLGINEVGRDRKTGKILIRVNPKFFRPAEVDLLIGNPAKAKLELDWVAETSLEELAQMMVDADLRRVASGVSF
jgi:GDPmannose 4,6-dehydratase